MSWWRLDSVSWIKVLHCPSIIPPTSKLIFLHHTPSLSSTKWLDSIKQTGTRRASRNRLIKWIGHTGCQIRLGQTIPNDHTRGHVFTKPTLGTTEMLTWTTRRFGTGGNRKHGLNKYTRGRENKQNTGSNNHKGGALDRKTGITWAPTKIKQEKGITNILTKYANYCC